MEKNQKKNNNANKRKKIYNIQKIYRYYTYRRKTKKEAHQNQTTSLDTLL